MDPIAATVMAAGTTVLCPPFLLYLRERGRRLRAEGELVEAERALDGLLEERSDISELRRRALTDHLTGLGNRVLFEDRLQQAASTARRHGIQSGVLYLDLNGFKQVNDTLGHAAGDQLLKMVGRRILAAVRETDTVCRLGGDEFAVILQGVLSLEGLEQVRSKIGAAIAEPVVIEGTTVQVGSSIGIAVYPEAETPEALVALADRRMYEQKQAAHAQLRPRRSAARQPVTA